VSKWVGIRESTRFTTGSDWVGLKFILQISIGLIFDPAHLKPDSPGLNPRWTELVNQSANKGLQSVFC